MAERLNLMRHLLFTPPGCLHWRRVSCPYTKFFEKSFNFLVDLSVLHLIDNYAKSVMSGVRTLCANAHYRASLFEQIFDRAAFVIEKNAEFLKNKLATLLATSLFCLYNSTHVCRFQHIRKSLKQTSNDDDKKTNWLS